MNVNFLLVGQLSAHSKPFVKAWSGNGRQQLIPFTFLFERVNLN